MASASKFNIVLLSITIKKGHQNLSLSNDYGKLFEIELDMMFIYTGEDQNGKETRAHPNILFISTDFTHWFHISKNFFIIEHQTEFLHSIQLEFLKLFINTKHLWIYGTLS